MFLSPIVLLALTGSVLAACDCGYSIKRISDTQHQVFTDAIETDFRAGNDVTWSSQEGFAWQVQEYNTSTAASRGPFGKAARIENVVLNHSNGSTGTEDLGVQLWVRRRLLSHGSDRLVPMAELATARNDILYGSFRFTMRTTPVNGTCGAAFFYHNDSQEIDMEVLSKQQASTHGTVQLVVQSPASVAAGFNAVNTSSLRVASLASAPSTSSLEYRFDWSPEGVDFYLAGTYQWTVHDSIPDSPGQIHLSHWSNGDPNWSGGPPEQDAVLTVSSVKAYFNSSLPTRAEAFEAACASSRVELCDPDLPDPPSTELPSSTSSVSIATPSSGAVTWHKRNGSSLVSSAAWYMLLLVILPSL